jgi:hypothetical protein
MLRVIFLICYHHHKWLICYVGLSFRFTKTKIKNSSNISTLVTNKISIKIVHGYFILNWFLFSLLYILWTSTNFSSYVFSSYASIWYFWAIYYLFLDKFLFSKIRFIVHSCLVSWLDLVLYSFPTQTWVMSVSKNLSFLFMAYSLLKLLSSMW